MPMILPTITITLTTTPPKLSLATKDHLMVKVVVDHLEVLLQEEEARNLSIINTHFRTTDLREVHTKVTETNIATTANHTSRVIKQTHTEEEAVVMPHFKQGDVAMVGPTIILTITTNTSIMVMINRLNNMAHLVVYAEVSFIL